jgi:hypothetical protein
MSQTPPIRKERWATIPTDAQTALLAVFHSPERLAGELEEKLDLHSTNSAKPILTGPPRGTRADQGDLTGASGAPRSPPARARQTTADGRIEALRAAGKLSVEADDALSAAWRNLDDVDGARLVQASDVRLLVDLIKRRLSVLPAFAALARADIAAARGLLLSRYLGKGVPPDGKFGGYTFEFSTTLDDLREVGGQEALRNLVEQHRCARARRPAPARSASGGTEVRTRRSSGAPGVRGLASGPS